MSPDFKLGMDRAYGFGRTGYDEVDVDSAGGLIHRLLFEAGVEVEIRFEAFQYAEKGEASDVGK